MATGDIMDAADLAMALARRRDSTLLEAFNAGFDSGVHGASDINCHFRFFRTPQHTAAWEHGLHIGRSLIDARKQYQP